MFDNLVSRARASIAKRRQYNRLVAEIENLSGRDLADLRADELAELCRLMGIPHSGTKPTKIARLLDAADLPGELAIGAVGRDPGDAGVVGILRESQRRFLIIVRASAADALWTELLAAGEPLDASFVGCDAITLLGAAHAEEP